MTSNDTVICERCGRAVDFSEVYEIDLTSFDDYDDADDYSALICADCTKYAFSAHADIIECLEEK